MPTPRDGLPAHAQGLLGDRATATEMTIRARDLVGEQAAFTLLQLVRDAAQSPERAYRRRGNPVSADVPGNIWRENRMALKLSQIKATSMGLRPRKQQGNKSIAS